VREIEGERERQKTNDDARAWRTDASVKLPSPRMKKSGRRFSHRVPLGGKKTKNDYFRCVESDATTIAQSIALIYLYAGWHTQPPAFSDQTPWLLQSFDGTHCPNEKQQQQQQQQQQQRDKRRGTNTTQRKKTNVSRIEACGRSGCCLYI
jgi:hypothetical protein